MRSLLANEPTTVGNRGRTTSSEKSDRADELGYRSPKSGNIDEFLARERCARRAVVAPLCGAGMMVTSDSIGGLAGWKCVLSMG